MRFCGRCSLFKKIFFSLFSCFLVEFRCMLIQLEFIRVYFLVLCWWVKCGYIVVIRFLYYLYVRVCVRVCIVVQLDFIFFFFGSGPKVYSLFGLFRLFSSTTCFEFMPCVVFFFFIVLKYKFCL